VIISDLTTSKALSTALIISDLNSSRLLSMAYSLSVYSLDTAVSSPLDVTPLSGVVQGTVSSAPLSAQDYRCYGDQVIIAGGPSLCSAFILILANEIES
jgi:hypothetical protein